MLHRRRVFAGVENFFLYDLFTPEGGVDENVFAYSNVTSGYEADKRMEERGLVIYHNKFADTRGWIKTSAAFLENGQLRQKSLADGLGLPNDGYVIFRDGITNLEYIRSCREMREQGLYVELGAYKCHTFLDFRFVEGSNWGLVNGNLNGAGISSMQGKFDEMFGAKKEEVVAEEVKVKKPRKKVVKKEEKEKKPVVVKKESSSAKTAVKEAIAKKATKSAAQKRNDKTKATVKKKPDAKIS